MKNELLDIALLLTDLNIKLIQLNKYIKNNKDNIEPAILSISRFNNILNNIQKNIDLAQDMTIKSMYNTQYI